MKNKSKMLKVGDIFQIPLSLNRYAYGQFVYKSVLGPLVVIFDYFNDGDINCLTDLSEARLLIPPVLTGLGGAIRLGSWKIVGRLPFSDFSKTKFISPWWNQVTGEVYHWSLWDGEKFIRLGKELPDEYKNLELCLVWDPKDIEERIEKGELPFPYKEMIRDGRFPSQYQLFASNGFFSIA